MTYKENSKILENYLHVLQNVEEVAPGPSAIEAMGVAAGIMKAADETVEYGVFVWDKERGIYIPIGRLVGTKQLCLNRYRERVKGGYIPEWLDPEKFKVLKRTVVEIVDEWKEDKED